MAPILVIDHRPFQERQRSGTEHQVGERGHIAGPSTGQAAGRARVAPRLRSWGRAGGRRTERNVVVVLPNNRPARCTSHRRPVKFRAPGALESIWRAPGWGGAMHYGSASVCLRPSTPCGHRGTSIAAAGPTLRSTQPKSARAQLRGERILAARMSTRRLETRVHESEPPALNGRLAGARHVSEDAYARFSENLLLRTAANFRFVLRQFIVRRHAGAAFMTKTPSSGRARDPVCREACSCAIDPAVALGRAGGVASTPSTERQRLEIGQGRVLAEENLKARSSRRGGLSAWALGCWLGNGQLGTLPGHGAANTPLIGGTNPDSSALRAGVAVVVVPEHHPFEHFPRPTNRSLVETRIATGGIHGIRFDVEATHLRARHPMVRFSWVQRQRTERFNAGRRSTGRAFARRDCRHVTHRRARGRKTPGAKPKKIEAIGQLTGGVWRA